MGWAVLENVLRSLGSCPTGTFKVWEISGLIKLCQRYFDKATSPHLTSPHLTSPYLSPLTPLLGRRGDMEDDVADSFLHRGLSSVSWRSVGMLKVVQSRTFSVQLFLCLPLFLPPSVFAWVL